MTTPTPPTEAPTPETDAQFNQIQTAKQAAAFACTLERQRDAALAELARVTKERDSLADQLATSTRTVENYEALAKRYVTALEVEGSKLRAANLS